MTYENLRKKHEIIQKLIDATGDEELHMLSRFMRSRIRCPESYVTMLGETSSGKSTLINGLLQKKLLQTSAAPTTGTVVEVFFDPDAVSADYYAINRDATMEQLDRNTFTALSCNPDKALSRLRVAVPQIPGLSGLRLFDTPGYGSIVEQHEEVLRNFIPNSDVIIYVIGYKIGIQENDFLFMRCIQELIHDDTEIIIVVNRCPAGISDKDRRMQEIRRYANDLLHKSVPILTVASESGDAGEVLPQAADLWAYVSKLLSAPQRQQTLIHTLNVYLDDLLTQADRLVEKRELAQLLDQQEREELTACAEEFRRKGDSIFSMEIDPVFNRLIADAPRLLAQAEGRICDELSSVINNEKTGKMDETISYVNNHALPMAIKRETMEYEKRLMLELDAMNERIDNYLNEAIASYYREVELRFGSNAEMAIRTGTGKIVGEIMENGLRQFFAAYGGAGGVGAGMANAAKHILKKAGDLIGKRFSRKTYNALAHAMKKIGFTSVKFVGYAVAAIIEVVQVIFDYSTWKFKLTHQMKKGLEQWRIKTLETIITDLESLKAENKKTLIEIIEETASAYEYEAEGSDDQLPELIALRKETHRLLEEMFK